MYTVHEAYFEPKNYFDSYFCYKYDNFLAHCVLSYDVTNTRSHRLYSVMIVG